MKETLAKIENEISIDYLINYKNVEYNYYSTTEKEYIAMAIYGTSEKYKEIIAGLNQEIDHLKKENVRLTTVNMDLLFD